MKYIRVLPAELNKGLGGNPSLESETLFSSVGACFSSAQSPNLDYSTRNTAQSPCGSEERATKRATVDWHHLPPASLPRRRSRHSFICQNCGETFNRKLKGAKVHKYCSPECGNQAKVGKPAPGFITPESDKSERIRANGLINRRLQLGWFEKPTACMKCGKSKRLDSHHPDYSKPDHVYWLCRSCHLLSHHNPAILEGLAPFLCSDQRNELQKPKPHGKGGHFGPRSNEARISRCKLTLEDAAEIRRLDTTFMSQQEIAERFGVSQMTVSRIVRNERLHDPNFTPFHLRLTPSPLPTPSEAPR